MAVIFAAVGPSSMAAHGFAFGGEALSAAQASRSPILSISGRPVVLTVCVMLTVSTLMGQTPTLDERAGSCVPLRRVNPVPLVTLSLENLLFLEPLRS